MPFWEKDHVKSYDDFARADNNDRSDAGVLAAKAGRQMPGSQRGRGGGTSKRGPPGPPAADHILVVLPSGETIKKNKVKSNDTIRAIKQEVHNQTDFPIYQLRIFYRGEELKDDRTLGSYSISKGSTLSLVVDESAVDDVEAYRQQLLKDIEARQRRHMDIEVSTASATSAASTSSAVDGGETLASAASTSSAASAVSASAIVLHDPSATPAATAPCKPAVGTVMRMRGGGTTEEEEEEKEECTECKDSDFKRKEECRATGSAMGEGVGLAPCHCGRLFCKNCIEAARAVSYTHLRAHET